MNLFLRKPFGAIIASYMRNSEKLPKYIRTKKTVANALPVSHTENSSAQRKVAPAGPKITLVHNQSVTITTFKEAQKLAKRRDLRLLNQQDVDTKTQRPVYKLVTAGEMLSENPDGTSLVDNRKSAEKRSEKSLTIGSRISEHDLSSRLKQISKWLSKNHEVYILVQGSPEETTNCEKIVKAIEQSVKEPGTLGRIVHKRAKGSHIKFNIIPAAMEVTAAKA